MVSCLVWSKYGVISLFLWLLKEFHCRGVVQLFHLRKPFVLAFFQAAQSPSSELRQRVIPWNYWLACIHNRNLLGAEAGTILLSLCGQAWHVIPLCLNHELGNRVRVRLRSNYGHFLFEPTGSDFAFPSSLVIGNTCTSSSSIPTIGAGIAVVATEHQHSPLDPMSTRSGGRLLWNWTPKPMSKRDEQGFSTLLRGRWHE